MEMILRMAKAHLENVSVQRDKLIAQRTELTKKIEEIEEFLRIGIQAVSEAAKVEDEKPSTSEKEPTALDKYANRKDFS